MSETLDNALLVDAIKHSAPETPTGLSQPDNDVAFYKLAKAVLEMPGVKSALVEFFANMAKGAMKTYAEDFLDTRYADKLGVSEERVREMVADRVEDEISSYNPCEHSDFDSSVESVIDNYDFDSRISDAINDQLDDKLDSAIDDKMDEVTEKVFSTIRDRLS